MTSFILDGEFSIGIPWAHDDASPKVIHVLEAGDRVDEAKVTVDTPFNDSSASFKLGTIGVPERWVAAAIVDPLGTHNYGDPTNDPQPAAATIILTITPATSTQGDGVVYIKIRRL